jgi:hypothetical protein
VIAGITGEIHVCNRERRLPAWPRGGFCDARTGRTRPPKIGVAAQPSFTVGHDLVITDDATI